MMAKPEATSSTTRAKAPFLAGDAAEDRPQLEVDHARRLPIRTDGRIRESCQAG